MNKMNQRSGMRLLAVGLLVGLVAGGPAAGQEREKVRAFPGAEGFGAFSRGGRGGSVLLVTNLDDYDPKAGPPIAGSFRAACLAKGPRIVIFRVAGTIAMKAPLDITEPYLTLAGQSAPGDGVCIRGRHSSIHTHDVIVRHMRFRPGDDLATPEELKKLNGEHDALSIDGYNRQIDNIIFDHCSLSWAIDETTHVYGNPITNVTIQWCILSESLHKSIHPKGPHGDGIILKCNGNVSFHHNLLAKHNTRSPRPASFADGTFLFDFRNNVIYLSHGYAAKNDSIRLNYVGNYLKRLNQPHAFFLYDAAKNDVQVFAQGNFLEGGGARQTDDWSLFAGAKYDAGKDLTSVWGEIASRRAKEEFSVPAWARVTTHAAPEAYAKVLDQAGAVRPRRDAVDARVIREVRDGTGDIINSQKEVGGWPELKAAPPPGDADGDAMPDDWEKKHGLDPADPSDAAKDKDADGYTNIEDWLNEMATSK